MLIKESRRGFTFIEILVVVAITVMVSLISLVAISGWKRQHDLNTTAQKIATFLRDAQVKAMSQELGASWGVYFSNSSTSPYVALFYGDSYSTSTQRDYLSLPSSVIFNTSTLPLNSTSAVVFSQISGEVDPTKSRNYQGNPFTPSAPFSLNILLGTNNTGNNQSSTIDVSNIGQIKFVTLSCLVVCSQTSVTLPSPPALSLTAAPASISSGQSATISWTTTDASSCDATWTPSKKTADSKTVSPAVTTSYAMTCTGSGGNVTQSVTVTVGGASDTTPPSVSITNPLDGDTVSGGNVSVTATASDNVGVAGVQFQLDGVNLGNEDTSAPYTTSWNTNQSSNGSHSLTAIARDAAGNMTTAAAITVDVSNNGGGGGGGGGMPGIPL